MQAKFSYVMVFVADVARAVKFYRDALSLPLKFESPEWSEFATGETTLALHPASPASPAGKIELALTVPDIHACYREMTAKSVKFIMPPTKQDYGGMLAQYVDSEGTIWSLGEAATERS